MNMSQTILQSTRHHCALIRQPSTSVNLLCTATIPTEYTNQIKTSKCSDQPSTWISQTTIQTQYTNQSENIAHNRPTQSNELWANCTQGIKRSTWGFRSSPHTASCPRCHCPPAPRWPGHRAGLATSPGTTLSHPAASCYHTQYKHSYCNSVILQSPHPVQTHTVTCLLFHYYHTQYKHTPVTCVSVVLQSPHPVQKCTPVYSQFTQYKPSHLFTVPTPCTLTLVYSKHTQYTHTCAITTPSTHSHLFTVITPSTNTHTYSPVLLWLQSAQSS